MSEQAQVPVDALPLVDRHGFRTTVQPEQVWAALAPTLMAAFGKRRSRTFAKALGCRERRLSRPFLMENGDKLVGFRVLASRPPEELVLEGEHHFASYALIFRIGSRDGITTVTIETRATFPGAKGYVYRELVVATGLHAQIVRRLLKGLRRRAEWNQRPSGRRRTGAIPAGR